MNRVEYEDNRTFSLLDFANQTAPKIRSIVAVTGAKLSWNHENLIDILRTG